MKLRFHTTSAEARDPVSDARLTIRQQRAGTWAWSVDVPVTGGARMSIGSGETTSEANAKGAARKSLERHKAKRRAAEHAGAREMTPLIKHGETVRVTGGKHTGRVGKVSSLFRKEDKTFDLHLEFESGEADWVARGDCAPVDPKKPPSDERKELV